MPRKGENIYKRKDGRWEGRYIKSCTTEGKPIFGYVYAKTYRDVKIKLHTASSLPPVVLTPPAPDLFETAAQEWLRAPNKTCKEVNGMVKY